MESFVDELPKAELHLHLVGSASGLFVTLNSDDPPMFGTSLTQEYRRAASVLGLSRDQLADLARNGARASFLDQPAKQALIDEIDKVASRPF
jgi:aminodeoxyfutalosine deaminase